MNVALFYFLGFGIATLCYRFKFGDLDEPYRNLIFSCIVGSLVAGLLSTGFFELQRELCGS